MVHLTAAEVAAVLVGPGLNGEANGVGGAAKLAELPALPGRHDGEFPVGQGHVNFVHHDDDRNRWSVLADAFQHAGETKVEPPSSVGEGIVLKEDGVGRTTEDGVGDVPDRAAAVGIERGEDVYTGDWIGAATRIAEDGDVERTRKLFGEMSGVVADAVEERRQCCAMM